jgi:hypothetical protein
MSSPALIRAIKYLESIKEDDLNEVVPLLLGGYCEIAKAEGKSLREVVPNEEFPTIAQFGQEDEPNLEVTYARIISGQCGPGYVEISYDHDNHAIDIMHFPQEVIYRYELISAWEGTDPDAVMEMFRLALEFYGVPTVNPLKGEIDVR